jgi:rRNA maturation endonuclease Nob1
MTPEEGDVVVMRCGICGDTFPLAVGGEQRCPTCGNAGLDLAHEPVL